MNYASIDNHMVSPAADDEAYYRAQEIDYGYHEESGKDVSEPMTPHPSLPTMPDTPAARAWKKRLMEACK